MKLKQIETLLLQEMEDVKGGASGTCECLKGAGQKIDEGGSCVCTSGAAQKVSGDDKCLCSGGGAGQ